jgi:hypothetical protein
MPRPIPFSSSSNFYLPFLSPLSPNHSPSTLPELNDEVRLAMLAKQQKEENRLSKASSASGFGDLSQDGAGFASQGEGDRRGSTYSGFGDAEEADNGEEMEDIRPESRVSTYEGFEGLDETLDELNAVAPNPVKTKWVTGTIHANKTAYYHGEIETGEATLRLIRTDENSGQKHARWLEFLLAVLLHVHEPTKPFVVVSIYLATPPPHLPKGLNCLSPPLPPSPPPLTNQLLLC